MNELPPVRVPHPHVECNEQGIPMVVGTSVPVRRIFTWYLKGVKVETLLKRYPKIQHSYVLDALSFGYDNIDLINADMARERDLMNGAQRGPATTG